MNDYSIFILHQKIFKLYDSILLFWGKSAKGHKSFFYSFVCITWRHSTLSNLSKMPKKKQIRKVDKKKGSIRKVSIFDKNAKNQVGKMQAVEYLINKYKMTNLEAMMAYDSFHKGPILYKWLSFSRKTKKNNIAFYPLIMLLMKKWSVRNILVERLLKLNFWRSIR